MRVKTIAWSSLLGALLLAASGHAEPKGVKTPTREAPLSSVFPDENPGAKSERYGSVLVSVAQGAEVEKAPSTNLLLGTGSKTTPTYVFRLSSGRLDVSIPPEQVSKVAVLIMGPRGVSGVVKGGHTTAHANANSVSYTTQGHEMLVGKGSRWRALAAGNTRTVDFRSGLSKDSEIPTAPAFHVTSGLTLAVPGAGFKTGVELEPVKNAAEYQMVLYKKDSGRLSVVHHATTREARAELRGQAPGEYAVVTRALDARGLASEPSSPMPLRVMGIELPKGAEMVDSTILLRPSQRVPLVAAEGLKMTYGPSTYFVDAPNSVGLGRESVTTVRFVEPTSKAELRLSMAPYITKANVEIGPRSARWPDDHVRVKVRLHDGAGRAVPPSNNIKTLVSVNLEPVKVKWQREGQALSGFIAPPGDLVGPWVVRVEVSNELGELIGRDFLEVVGSRSPGRGGESSVARR